MPLYKTCVFEMLAIPVNRMQNRDDRNHKETRQGDLIAHEDIRVS